MMADNLPIRDANRASKTVATTEVASVHTPHHHPVPVPLAFTQVAGSPFTLTSSWVKVATTTTATRGLRIAPVPSATDFDIEWISVTADASAPTDTNGEPIFGGEDFAGGIPVGDIYLKSASGQIVIVKTGA